jgi:phosphatidylinositol-3-phosphatase
MACRRRARGSVRRRLGPERNAADGRLCGDRAARRWRRQRCPAPAPDHIVIVVFENKDVDEVLQSSQAPYLDQLASSGVNFDNAYAETHPSQPNYLALFSGSTQGVTDNSCLGPLDAPNLATQLLAAGRSFVGFSEDLPGAGFTGCRSGGFVQKHAPWSAFTNVPANAHQPWSAWPDRYEQLPTVAVVIPDLCDDMHDCDVATGDGGCATTCRTTWGGRVRTTAC